VFLSRLLDEERAVLRVCLRRPNCHLPRLATESDFSRPSPPPLDRHSQSVTLNCFSLGGARGIRGMQRVVVAAAENCFVFIELDTVRERGTAKISHAAKPIALIAQIKPKRCFRFYDASRLFAINSQITSLIKICT
jgi:hypothetical protein